MPRRSIAAAVALAIVSIRVLAGQQPKVDDPPRFKVGVDAVRIDAVVTDRDGRIVKDLTAEDFEIFQDGKRQTVTFAQYVPVISSRAAADGPRPGAIAPTPSMAPTLTPVRGNVQRTLAIVIDDLGLSVEGLFIVKRALHAFVERNVLTTDLVGILRTGGFGGPLAPFTTDPRMLHRMIDDLRWNGLSRNAVEPFAALNEWTTFEQRGSGLADVNDFRKLDTLRASALASGTLGALNLAVKGARDLPGRKSLLFVSEGFSLLDEEKNIDTRVRGALDRVIDQAVRAGVVIYSLDARGLQTAGLQAADNIKRPRRTGQSMEEATREAAEERFEFNQRTQDALAYVAEQTGGFAVLNTNDLGSGFARISNDIRDYYVIGYVPAQGTFVDKGKKPSYHKITVKVRRPGVRVRTRKEFLGVSDVDEPPPPATPRDHLIRAAISPLMTTDIALRVTTVPAYTTLNGLFVRTQLHIDARGLTFAPSENDRKTASADVLGMVFDRDGTEVAHLSTGFSVALSDNATEEALRHGLLYTFRVPIPRAGAYQLRFAIRDRESGTLGSAGEFVELNDVARGEFAVSGIVLGDNPASFAPDADGTVVSAAQALREYSPGSPLSYAYEVYNPGEQVRITSSIWRGAQQVVTLPIETLKAPAPNARRFGAAGHLKLGEALPRGGYVLQVTAVTGGAAKNRVRTAVQRTPFEVR
jgi:VWFA-related protein